MSKFPNTPSVSRVQLEPSSSHGIDDESTFPFTERNLRRHNSSNTSSMAEIPIDAFAWLTLYNKYYGSISEILPGLFIGDAGACKSEATMRSRHITAVVSLKIDPYHAWNEEPFKSLIAKDRHLWFECCDSPVQDILKYLDEACDFIDRMMKQPPEFIPTKSGMVPASLNPHLRGGVLIHCVAGVSRSSSILIAYLMRKYHQSFEEMLFQVRIKHPRASPNSNFRKQLRAWRDLEYQLWQDKEKTMPKPLYGAFLRHRVKTLMSAPIDGQVYKCLSDKEREYRAAGKETPQFHGLYADFKGDGELKRSTTEVVVESNEQVRRSGSKILVKRRGTTKDLNGHSS